MCALISHIFHYRKSVNFLETVKIYTCPSCGAPLAYDGTTKSLHCSSCDNDFAPETLEQLDADDAEASGQSVYDWTKYEPRTFDDTESAEFCTYSCPACGAEITGSGIMGATVCPYCGNAAIVKKQFEGSYRPDFVLPFSVDKKKAMVAFENAFEKLPFLPDAFKSKKKIEEMSGVYVPFWLFDCKANAAITYRGERVTAWSDARFDHVKTDHYKIFRSGTLDFAGLPTDASQKADDAYMESLEPFRLEEAVPFDTGYLAGYFADKYDVSAAESEKRANERVRTTTERVFADTVNGFVGVRPEKSSIRFSDGKIRYCMLPVWMLHIAYEGQSYAYAINGQTGKVVGSFPIDKKKRNRYFAKVFGIGAAIMLFLLLLMSL